MQNGSGWREKMKSEVTEAFRTVLGSWPERGKKEKKNPCVASLEEGKESPREMTSLPKEGTGSCWKSSNLQGMTEQKTLKVVLPPRGEKVTSQGDPEGFEPILFFSLSVRSPETGGRENEEGGKLAGELENNLWEKDLGLDNQQKSGLCCMYLL